MPDLLFLGKDLTNTQPSRMFESKTFRVANWQTDIDHVMQVATLGCLTTQVGYFGFLFSPQSTLCLNEQSDSSSQPGVKMNMFCL